jgi:cell cycle checkpoint protein
MGPLAQILSYRFNFIVRTIRALQSSSKTSLRIDEEGVLSMQFLMPRNRKEEEEGFGNFMEFKVSGSVFHAGRS